MKTIPLLLCLGAAFTLAAPFAAPLRADEHDDNVATIAFSKAGAPRTLRVETNHGDISIQGADVDKVTVRSDSAPTPASARRSDGLRVITSSNSYNLTERDNVVSLSQDSGSFFGGGGDFAITVPRDTTVVAKVGIAGDVTIRDIAGDVEVSNLNGEITLEKVSGGVAVDTMNGEISARYAALPDGKSHSFSSMNGEIRILVPATAKATFTLRAQNGTVATDFDEKVLVTKTERRKGSGLPGMDAARMGIQVAREAMEMAREVAQSACEEARQTAKQAMDEAGKGGEAPSVEKAPHPPKPPLPPRAPRFSHFPAFGGQVVTGTLNGGGVDIRATTMNGEIQVREAK